MKKTIKLAVVAALALGATTAFATNGSNMIATGAKATGMGGVGIGMSHGAESALVNPALITSVESSEISFGGTLFMPNVKNTNDLGGGASSATSEAKINVIPEVSLASKINDNFYMGVGMWGTAGMGVDYRDPTTTTQMNMVTNLQLMQFGVPLAYKMNNFSAAITPLLQYGSLDINYDAGGAMGINKVGAGVAQSLKFGYNLGVAYEIANVTFGVTYKSQIDMEYKGVLANAMNPMVSAMSGGANKYTNDILSTPAEIGVGASYKFSNNTVAVDYKQIKWSAAKGYQDFEWKDQNVIALGYQYATKQWAARLGYNYSKSPISEQTYSGYNSAGLNSGLANTFNLLGFPGIVQSHMTVGGSYSLSDKASVDLAYVYTPEVSNTYKNFTGTQDITTKHSQTALSAQLNYKF